MNAAEPIFWIMIASIVIAICFIVMAIALIAIALIVRKIVGTVGRVEEKINPLLTQVNAISEQGKQISVQFTEISTNLSTATKYFSESAGLVREEIAELKQLVGETAIVAKDKVELVSRTIDRTQLQVVTTTDYIETKIVEPAREIAAVMAGVRKGLEVLFAPSPKQIDRVYTEDELFIG
jgi:ABC-type transporter Mla subunit MlaD